MCATIKIQFDNTILSHTHPPLSRYASSRVRPPPPPFENSGSAPGYIAIHTRPALCTIVNTFIFTVYNQEKCNVNRNNI